jgi:hypothetical protein
MINDIPTAYDQPTHPADTGEPPPEDTIRYTPGPWRIENGTYRDFEFADIATVYCVERVPTEDGLGANHVTIVGARQGNGHFEAEQSANAKLIASAPDLLKRLELTTDSLEILLFFAGHHLDAEKRKLIERRIEGNYAVITKATAA